MIRDGLGGMRGTSATAAIGRPRRWQWRWSRSLLLLLAVLGASVLCAAPWTAGPASAPTPALAPKKVSQPLHVVVLSTRQAVKGSVRIAASVSQQVKAEDLRLEIFGFAPDVAEVLRPTASGVADAIFRSLAQQLQLPRCSFRVVFDRSQVPDVFRPALDREGKDFLDRHVPLIALAKGTTAGPGHDRSRWHLLSGGDEASLRQELRAQLLSRKPLS